MALLEKLLFNSRGNFKVSQFKTDIYSGKILICLIFGKNTSNRTKARFFKLFTFKFKTETFTIDFLFFFFLLIVFRQTEKKFFSLFHLLFL